MTKLEQFRQENPAYKNVPDAELAYALHRKFYSNTPYGLFAAEIGLSREARRAMLRMAEADGQELTARGVSNEVPELNKTRSLLQGMTFGFGDEIAAAGAAAGDKLMGEEGSFGDRYDAHLANERLRLDQGRQNAPLQSIGSEILGAVAVPGAALNLSKNVGLRALQSGLLAGLGGAVYGFGQGQGGVESRAENSLEVGLLSAALGGGGSLAVSAAMKPITDARMRAGIRRAAASAPDNETLQREAARIYAAADQAVIPRAGLAQVAQDASNKISPRGINERLLPKSAAVMDELTDVATAPNPNLMFGDLEDVRKLTRVPRADFLNPAEQRAGGILAESIDNFVDQIDPALSKEITEARRMWSILRKNELVMEAIEKANNQASGFENGLRIQFRQILNNKKVVSQFTEAEREAMRQVVRGTPLGNAMKAIGKLGFGRGQQTNVLGGTMGVGVFGPVMPLAGQAALAGSEAITARRAGLLQDLVRTGGAPNLTPLTDQTAAYLQMLGRQPARAAAPTLGLLGMQPQ